MLPNPHAHQCCLLADIGAVSVVVGYVVMLVILRNSLVVFDSLFRSTKSMEACLHNQQ